MSKKCIMILALILSMFLQNMEVEAAGLTFNEPIIEVGKVVEVIDGEVIKVFFFRRDSIKPTIETVKIIGIDTEASVNGFDYTSQRLLGKIIYLTYESGTSYLPTQMIHANVFLDYNRSFAEEILDLGYAKVNETYKNSTYYYDFLNAENNAKLTEVGRWATNLTETTDKININTATSTQMSEILDIDLNLAFSIVTYRQNNLFNDITEVMAVNPYFDAKWFENNRHLLSVVTSITKASYLELSSLLPPSSNTQQVIDGLYYHTRFNEIRSLDDLKSISTFAYYYDTLRPFLTLSTEAVITETNKKAVNINTASFDTLINIFGISTAEAQKIIMLRANGTYTIDTIGELFASNILVNRTLKSIYTNKLTTYTDLNTSDYEELKSLFESFEKDITKRNLLISNVIKNRPYKLKSDVKKFISTTIYAQIEPFIYVYKDEISAKYNPNTTTVSQAKKLDVTYKQQKTNYTNINMASKEVMMDLNEDMTLNLVNAILDYRSKHDFRFQDDLKQIFETQKKLALYNRISPFLTFE